MKKAPLAVGWLILFSIVLSPALAAQAVSGKVLLKRNAGRVELSWPTALTNDSAQQVLPEYQVQYSPDLREWSPIGGRVVGVPGRSGSTLTVSMPEQPAPLFFRITANLDSIATNQVAAGGAEVFGYNARLNQELATVGRLSPEEFGTNFTADTYLPQLTWDPTTAQYWTNFNSPRLFYAGYGYYDGFEQQIPYNFQPNSAETALFQTNGFFVSERMGSVTFGDAYYRIFNADLPVFVTADSVLHAWHHSYDAALSELEETWLSTVLEQVLVEMSKQLPAVWQQYGAGPLRDSVLDADFFLTVARSLCDGKQVGSSLADPSVDLHVADALAAVHSLAPNRLDVFGSERVVDFSQFKVRGHYVASDRLARYFAATMWCGRIDLRLASFVPNQEDDIRQLGTVLVLNQLLAASDEGPNWALLEEVTRLFVGPTDSLTFGGLDGLLQAARINSLADAPDLVTLTNLQTRLLSGELGVQSFPSEHLYSPLSAEQLKLPRSFTLTGQKFVLDAWALSQVVFDRVLWDSSDPATLFGKVLRRKPSGLDFAYSVLGNDAVVPELVSRIRATNGVPFRDGLPYQHNLLALRRTVDGQNEATWSSSIYSAWLAALRALSAPTTAPQFPEAMRTRAWAMKNLNTQLASWTELRHDTVLYVKQGSTPPALCSYPAGFVEPRPEFWEQMGHLAALTAAGISRLPLSGSITLPSHLDSSSLTLNLAVIKSNQVGLFNSFSNRMVLLKDMAERELAQRPFTDEQQTMMQDVVERYVDYVGVRQFTGWYPALFYRNAFHAARDADGPSWPNGFPPAPECDTRDVLVADVHTDQPDALVRDPGGVIHEGVGNINMLLVAVDNGQERMVYAGPVFSHYEIELPISTRLTDADLRRRLDIGMKPANPTWTESFLVPGTIQIPTGY